jgi:hypothetical protein
MLTRMSYRRSVLVPALLAVLHISTAVAEPILHGRTEVLSSAPAFELAHSDSCAVIHIESSCVAGSMHQFAGQTAADAPIQAQRFTTILPHHRNSLLPSFGVSLVNGVRGPPQG